MLARVDNVFDHNPHEDPLSSTVSEVIPFETKYAPEGDSTVIFREAHAEILEEAVLNGDGTINEIKSYDYRKTSFDLALFGSDSVVRAYNALLQYGYKGEANENMEQRGEMYLRLW